MERETDLLHDRARLALRDVRHGDVGGYVKRYVVLGDVKVQHGRERLVVAPKRLHGDGRVLGHDGALGLHADGDALQCFLARVAQRHPHRCANPACLCLPATPAAATARILPHLGGAQLELDRRRAARVLVLAEHRVPDGVLQGLHLLVHGFVVEVAGRVA